MDTRRLVTALAAFLMVAGIPARAQRFSLGTNAVDLATLGTLNLEASVSGARMLSFHAGAEFNPWAYGEPEDGSRMQIKQLSCWAGLRWWPWHVYSGWWAGTDARWSVYSQGGITSPETEEGNAWGAGVYGGYGVMLSDRWNLDLGAGLWGGWKQYRRYACPVCGRTLDQGSGPFLMPDARIAIQYVF